MSKPAHLLISLSVCTALLTILAALAAKLNPAITISRGGAAAVDSDEASVSPDETVTTICRLGPHLDKICCGLSAISFAAGFAGFWHILRKGD